MRAAFACRMAAKSGSPASSRPRPAHQLRTAARRWPLSFWDTTVTLQGEDDSPDRYGRQPAFVFLEGADTPVQGLLLAQGDA